VAGPVVLPGATGPYPAARPHPAAGPYPAARPTLAGASGPTRTGTA